MLWLHETQSLLSECLHFLASCRLLSEDEQLDKLESLNEDLRLVCLLFVGAPMFDVEAKRSILLSRQDMFKGHLLQNLSQAYILLSLYTDG